MPSNHLILCRSLLPPSVFPSIRVFSNESVFHIWWPKYWSFSFSISPSNEYSGLISFGLVLIPLAVQGTLKVQGPDKSGHQSNMKETAETSRLLGVPCGICAGNREGVLPNLPFSDGKTVLMFGVVKVV